MTNLYNPFLKAVSIDQFPEEAWQYLGGDTDTAGLQEYYQEVPWLFRGVDIRANAVASMPFTIYKGKDEFDTSEDYQNKVGFLPSPGVFFGLVEMALTIWGYGYAFKMRSKFTQKGLRYLDPTTIEVKIDGATGEVSFKRKLNGQVTKYTSEDIVYWWKPDPFVEIGPPKSSPSKAAAAAAGVLLNVDEFAGAFFKRGAIKVTLLTAKNVQPSERSRLKAFWQRVTGVDKAWQNEIVNAETVTPVVIGEGLESLENDSLTMSKRIDIAAAFGIPYSVLFSNASNRATAEQDDLHLYTKTIIPECNFIASVLNEQVFAKLGLRLEFTPENMDIFQEDEEARSQSISAFMDAFLKFPTQELAIGTLSMFGFELPPDMETAIQAYFTEKEQRREEMAQIAAQAPAPQEQEEQPPNNQPPQLSNNNPQREDMRAVDIGKWRTKALKRVKAGRPAAVKFESEYIEPVIAGALQGALEEAQTEQDVIDVFANVWVGYP